MLIMNPEPYPHIAETRLTISEAHSIIATADESQAEASAAIDTSEAAAQEVAAQNTAHESWLLNDGPVGRQEARAALAAAQASVTQSHQGLWRVTERVNMAHNTLKRLYRGLGSAAVRRVIN